MILSPADIRALEKVCELTQFRKGHPRVFLGKRVRGPGGKGWLARQLDMSRMSVVRMLRGNQVSDEYALRALDFLRELRTDSPKSSWRSTPTSRGLDASRGANGSSLQLRNLALPRAAQNRRLISCFKTNGGNRLHRKEYQGIPPRNL